MSTRIAIIGAGKIARDQHVPAIRGNPGFDLVATADRVGGIDGVANHADFAMLLKTGAAIDAVAICTPPQVRAAIARTAIEAGLHVLLEKPPVATLAELDDLVARAARRGVCLFTVWHSRFAAMVPVAKAWLAGRSVVGGRIVWREDVRRWHPGQAWLWAPGGLGVFDPGINAFSILTELIGPMPLVVRARLEVPGNAHTPIAATLALQAGDAPIAVDLDFRQEGPQHWELSLDTACGHRLMLSDGGLTLAIDDGEPTSGANREYAAAYAHFDRLIAAGTGDADPAPLRMVADALLIAETVRTAPFYDDPHYQVA